MSDPESELPVPDPDLRANAAAARPAGCDGFFSATFLSRSLAC